VKRIRRLLYPQTSPSSGTPWLAALILMLTAVIALSAWQSETAQLTPPVDQHATSPYEKWLNEDVAYIIADTERGAFQRLTTDEKRDRFVEQFWERRNPNPGAVENAFKEEHYRRIAYANTHFSTAQAGWRTDRGRVYIVHGPPDEIESHPAGGGEGGPDPNEIWLYRHTDRMGDKTGIFGFADAAGNGQYKRTNAVGPVQTNPQAIRIAPDVAEQNLLNKVEPIYPPLAMQARIQGTVRFNVVIGKDGRISSAQLVSGHPILVNAARKATEQWTYQPILVNGEPAEVATQIAVTFTLPVR
jgi:TonB family protein